MKRRVCQVSHANQNQNLVEKNLHFYSSTISYSNDNTSSEYVKIPGGWASTCSTTSAEYQVIKGNSNYGENKNHEGGVLMYKVDSSKSASVNVNSLINFYNSLSTV